MGKIVIYLLRDLLLSGMIAAAGVLLFLYLGHGGKLMTEKIYIVFCSSFFLLYFFLRTSISCKLQCDLPPITGAKYVRLFAGYLSFAAVLFACLLALVSITEGKPTLNFGHYVAPLAVVVWILSAVLFEEVLFRGYLNTLFLQKLSPFASMLLTSIIFGLCHFPFKYGFLQFFAHFLFSCLLVTFTTREKCLLPAIVFHFFFNFSADFSHSGWELGSAHKGLAHFQSSAVTSHFLFWKVLVFSVCVVLLIVKTGNFFDGVRKNAASTTDPIHRT